MTQVSCQPGESVFEATERAVSEGTFPAGSRVLASGGTGVPYPTCPDQVGTVQVRHGERFAVQGPLGESR